MASARGDYDHRHLLVNEGDRAVFHLGGRVAFGVDIGDFLEFQGTFQGYRIVESAAQVQEIVRVGEGLCEVGDFRVVLENFRNLVRDVLQGADQFGAALLSDGAELFGETQGEKEEGGHLGGEGLGGGDTDFGTYVGVAAGVGGAGNG